MKKGKMGFILAVLFFAAISLVACLKNNTREIPPVAGACSGTPGPLFTAVKNLMAARCVSCHNSVIANGGKDFSIVCNIVINSSRIKVRAVDEGTMPATGPLPASEKTIISNWLNAGAKYTD